MISFAYINPPGMEEVKFHTGSTSMRHIKIHLVIIILQIYTIAI